MSSSELADEQAYLNEARDHRERSRHNIGSAITATASSKDAVAARRQTDGILSTFRAPEEAAAFGRIDTVEGDSYYVGYQLITNDDNDPLVINWQTPFGTKFYEASVDDPLGLSRRRQFQFLDSTNTLVSYDDSVFDAALLADLEDLVEAATPADIDDALLADLERARTGEMLDIVKTIRAAQHSIIRDDLDQLLIVQGGPGTGKTAVALHRVSWLLFNHRNKIAPKDVAVIGPNPTFIRYIREVLPSLGDQDVRQVSLVSLGPEVTLNRDEPPDVVTIKGEGRMAGLLDRALQDRVSVPDGTIELPVGNRSHRFDRRELTSEVDRLRNSPYSSGRAALREWLRRSSQSIAGGTPRQEAVDSVLDRIWPQLTAPAFLQDLLGSKERLLRAAGDDFTAREVELLYRKSAPKISEEQWSRADVPLLDHVAERMSGPGERFAHIVVDEAQDLSPMQLASIRRRSLNGSMTVLGDIAQSTGAWARDSWDQIIEELSHDDVPTNVTELEVGYRVPRQVFALAERLLPIAAPGVNAPRVVRDGPEPVLVPVGNEKQRADEVVKAARELLSRGLLVAVIATDAVRAGITAALDGEGVHWRNVAKDGVGPGINVIDPAEAKGLEFDAVVVAEPESIVRDQDRGARLLYVAFTRTTRHLTVVHIGPVIPDASAPKQRPTGSGAGRQLKLGEPEAPELEFPTPAVEENVDPVGSAPFKSDSATPPVPAPNSARPRVVGLLAATMADEIKASLPAELWLQVLAAIAEELDNPRD